MAGNGKKVLLHACCGPCSIMCIQSLRDEGYDVTGYFANPNIHPVSEYFRRREAMEQVAEQMDLPMLWQDDVYDLPGWLKMVHDLGIADNQGYARCGYCYESRTVSTALPQACCIPGTSSTTPSGESEPASRRPVTTGPTPDSVPSSCTGTSAPCGRPGSTAPRKWACTARTTVRVFSANTSGLRRS